jgi:hypothetical protein
MTKDEIVLWINGIENVTNDTHSLDSYHRRYEFFEDMHSYCSLLTQVGEIINI